MGKRIKITTKTIKLNLCPLKKDKFLQRTKREKRTKTKKKKETKINKNETKQNKKNKQSCSPKCMKQNCLIRTLSILLSKPNQYSNDVDSNPS